MTDSKSRVSSFFDNDASDYLKHKYASSGGSYMVLRKEKAKALISNHMAPLVNENFSLLDCGCGPGILLDFLSNYDIDYYGLDISEEMLRLARAASESGPSGRGKRRFLQGDVENLPFRSNSFDAAISLGVIEYLQEDDLLLEELGRITKRGSIVLIAVTNARSYNLLLERPLDALRRNNVGLRMLNFVKVLAGLGQFKKMEFKKRRHASEAFLESLASHDLVVKDSVFWGFNLLPHPLHYLFGKRANALMNSIFDKSLKAGFKSLGEGFIALCENRK